MAGALNHPRPRPPTTEASLLVEFMGLPGTGKTTLARRVGAWLEARGEATNLMLVASDPTMRGRLRAHGSALSHLASRDPAFLAASLTAIGASCRGGVDRLSRMSLNWCSHAARWQRLRSLPGIHIVDQGLGQVMWSLAFSCGPGAPTRVLERLDHRWPEPDVAIVVRASHGNVDLRLAGRGGTSGLQRRLEARPGDAAVFERAEEALDEVIELLRRRSGVFILELDNDREATLEASTELLGLQLQRLAGGGGTLSAAPVPGSGT